MPICSHPCWKLQPRRVPEITLFHEKKEWRCGAFCAVLLASLLYWPASCMAWPQKIRPKKSVENVHPEPPVKPPVKPPILRRKCRFCQEMKSKNSKNSPKSIKLYGCFQNPKIEGKPPKWTVKIMGNPMNKWMICGVLHPYFWKRPYTLLWQMAIDSTIPVTCKVGPEKLDINGVTTL